MMKSRAATEVCNLETTYVFSKCIVDLYFVFIDIGVIDILFIKLKA